jgi:hypothetical protein
MAELAEGRRVVTRDGDTLRMQRTGGEAAALRSLGDDRFETAEDRNPVRFLRGAGGRVVAVAVDGGFGPVLPSPRTEEPLHAESPQR